MATVFTVGHGTRSTDELVSLLSDARVELLVDVRRFPGSRRNPQFAREALERSLPERGIAYSWRESLGGRRGSTSSGQSRNLAWRVDAFRDYADHMQTAEFRGALRELESDAATRVLAVMCAETLWWKCHRRLISDALVGRGHDVIHLLGTGQSQAHKAHPNMRMEDGVPVYDVGVDRELKL